MIQTAPGRSVDDSTDVVDRVVRIVELRFKPSLKLLDRRGSLAERVSAALSLETAGVGENVAGAFESDNSAVCTITQKNAILRMVDATADAFISRARHLIRLLDTESHESGLNIPVHRIGCRILSAKHFAGTFQELNERICTELASLTPKAVEIIGVKSDFTVEDSAFSYELRGERRNMNLKFGPMRSDEFEKPLGTTGPFPDVGLFVDADAFLSKKEFSKRDTEESLERLTQDAESVTERLALHVSRGLERGKAGE